MTKYPQQNSSKANYPQAFGANNSSEANYPQAFGANNSSEANYPQAFGANNSSEANYPQAFGANYNQQYEDYSHYSSAYPNAAAAYQYSGYGQENGSYLQPSVAGLTATAVATTPVQAVVHPLLPSSQKPLIVPASPASITAAVKSNEVNSHVKEMTPSVIEAPTNSKNETGAKKLVIKLGPRGGNFKLQISNIPKDINQLHFRTLLQAFGRLAGYMRETKGADTAGIL